MAREPKVTLTLSEADARWLLDQTGTMHWSPSKIRVKEELKHALSECECREETR